MAKSYKCTNYGICPEADKGTVFLQSDLEEVDGKYVCPNPKCGQELEEIPSKKPVNVKLIALIAAGLVLLGGVGFAVAHWGGKDKAENGGEIEIVEEEYELEGEESDLDDEEEIVETPVDTKSTGTTIQPSGYALGWGTYEGPMQGGKPHGIGGEVKVSKSYSIDLKNGSSKQVFRGDKLVNTKFLNGKLVQGYIHRSNGEQESFVIGN